MFAIYLFGFLFSLHAALPTYINSSFLARFTTDRLVGLLYGLAAVAAVAAFTMAPRILRRFGNYRTVTFLLAAEFIALIGLATSGEAFFVALFFIASYAATAFIGFNLDMFLERFSKNYATGGIRGAFLTITNTAWVVAPLLASVILTDGDYWRIFLASAILLIPIFVLLAKHLKDFKDPSYLPLPLKKEALRIFGDRNIRQSFFVSFLLQFFYSWMVIYAPIYLYSYIGFSWREIGVMFSIMLLPFIFTEAPLGKLADKRFGEKEIMAAGFIIMAAATALLTFLPSKNFFLFAAVLFMTRIGASMVEIMSETYFFKKVDSGEADVISLFRTMRPVAYLIGPLLATALLGLSLPMKHIFVVLALIMLLGLRSSLMLKDTK